MGLRSLSCVDTQRSRRAAKRGPRAGSPRGVVALGWRSQPLRGIKHAIALPPTAKPRTDPSCSEIPKVYGQLACKFIGFLEPGQNFAVDLFRRFKSGLKMPAMGGGLFTFRDALAGDV